MSQSDQIRSYRLIEDLHTKHYLYLSMIVSNKLFIVYLSHNCSIINAELLAPLDWSQITEQFMSS